MGDLGRGGGILLFALLTTLPSTPWKAVCVQEEGNISYRRERKIRKKIRGMIEIKRGQGKRSNWGEGDIET